MSMRMCSIASGSSGNCIYVGSDNTHLLIDAGISGKSIEAGLNGIDISTSDIDGILVTHEHSDHIAGLGVLARRYGIDIYATEGTVEAIKGKNLGRIDEGLFKIIREDDDFVVNDLCVHAIKVPHDAAAPVAYRIGSNGSSIAVMTDLGYFDDYIVSNLQGLDALLLESNHDIRMLETGPYPYPLKQRILGNRGHLSNENAGRLLGRVINDNMQKIFLGHLSKENNLAELAYETVRLELDMGDNPYNSRDFEIAIASRVAPSELVCI